MSRFNFGSESLVNNRNTFFGARPGDHGFESRITPDQLAASVRGSSEPPVESYSRNGKAAAEYLAAHKPHVMALTN